MITKITPVEPACFGVMCPMHEHCERYHAAEGQPVHRIDTCVAEGDTRPLFVVRAVREAEGSAT
jgi:hypothetical protein